MFIKVAVIKQHEAGCVNLHFLSVRHGDSRLCALWKRQRAQWDDRVEKAAARQWGYDRFISAETAAPLHECLTYHAARCEARRHSECTVKMKLSLVLRLESASHTPHSRDIFCIVVWSQIMYTVCFHIDGHHLHRISDVLLNLCQNVSTREVSCRNDTNVFVDWCLKP